MNIYHIYPSINRARLRVTAISVYEKVKLRSTSKYNMRNTALILLLIAVCGGICQSIGDSNEDSSEESNGLLGGPKIITDEAELSKLSEKVIPHLATVGSQNNAQLELNVIHSATSQVVSGILYNIEAEMNVNSSPVNCTIKMWEQPWIQNFKNFNMKCGQDKNNMVIYIEE